jgi:hypothetical protein
MRAWVPMVDQHTLYFSMGRRPRGGAGPPAPANRFQVLQSAQLPNSTDWYGRLRLAATLANDYFIDRDAQREKVDYTGIPGIFTQDQAVTESMGAIFDRSQEHLANADAMVIRTRRRLLEVVRALTDAGQVPHSVDHPEVYRQRSGGVILPERANWIEATEELHRASR